MAGGGGTEGTHALVAAGKIDNKGKRELFIIIIFPKSHNGLQDGHHKTKLKTLGTKTICQILISCIRKTEDVVKQLLSSK